MMTKKKWLTYILILPILGGAVDLPASPISQMSEKVLQMRSEVEQHGQDLEYLRKNQEAFTEPLLTKKSELIAQIEKENLRREQIIAKQNAISTQQNKISSEYNLQERAFLNSWIYDLKKYTESRIPYRTTPRLENLENLRDNLATNSVSNLQVLEDLIKITETELKLAQSKEFKVQSITYEGNQINAEVIRLGMMQMIFALPSGELGYYEKNQASEWQPTLVVLDADKEPLSRMFSQFKNKNYRGWFKIPLTSNNLDEVFR
jgi:hypothetical protein